MANNPMKFTDPTGRDWWDIVRGTEDAILDNHLTGIAIRANYNPTNLTDYNQ